MEDNTNPDSDLDSASLVGSLQAPASTLASALAIAQATVSATAAPQQAQGQKTGARSVPQETIKQALHATNVIPRFARHTLT